MRTRVRLGDVVVCPSPPLSSPLPPEGLRSHHTATIHRILETLSSRRVTLKQSKCGIIVWRTEWLGFEMHRHHQNQGHQVARVTELTQPPTPRNAKEVGVYV